MTVISGLRDMDGSPVEFLKIAPGGFVIVDIDGEQKLVSRARWDALPIWGRTKDAARTRRYGPSHDALVIALIGAVIFLCEIIAWMLRPVMLAWHAIKRHIGVRLRGAASVGYILWPACIAFLN
ncbi:hypothetical protein RPMA_06715 [Tardiphaga alba]|uniref:Uncharacterized protein n=1 Tax=Tardiphaga alba TaxID=340268 RepID=A0ABX8A4F6_9BRAD|nr:hypothetical protein [Tardiphaga alba]QUS38559.1 hypothetical protein RPMA_06715 [Tardiphaga alba]